MKYLTVKSEIAAELTEKKSLFIATAAPAGTEDEAARIIERIKKKRWDAAHNVYAYTLRKGQIRRYSDDGEPQGTAGVPVLDVLVKKELWDTVIVVTRYFGGVLLGAGGLVRAYSGSASLALNGADILCMSECALCSLSCEYAMYERVSALIRTHGGAVESDDFSDKVMLGFYIEKERYEAFCAALTDLTLGKVSCLRNGIGWRAI